MLIELRVLEAEFLLQSNEIAKSIVITSGVGPVKFHLCLQTNIGKV
jgi:hypothetical protein